MADKQYPPGGALFKHEKPEGSKQPDVTGNLEISRELLDTLNALDKAGQKVKMRLAGWNKVTNGRKWLSLLASAEQQRQQPPPQQRVDDLDDDLDGVPF